MEEAGEQLMTLHLTESEISNNKAHFWQMMAEYTILRLIFYGAVI